MLTSVLLVVAGGLLFMIGFLVVSSQKHAGNMPVGASCSAVVSAACHRPQEDKEAFLFPVQWGEVPEEARRVRCNTGFCPGPLSRTRNDALGEPLLREDHGLALESDDIELLATTRQESRSQWQTVGHTCFTTATSVRLPQIGKLYQ